MNERQRRIIEDLSGQFQGDLRCDDLTLSIYSTDASLYQIRPLLVALPRSAEDVILLARYAYEQNLPLVPRGAGSGVAGGAIGAGIVVDFSRHMTSVEQIDEETVRVQPGLVCDKLNDILRPRGRYFAPDPSGSAVTTIGGMLGVDAAGSHAVRVGSTRDHVLSIDLVLAGGEFVEAGYIPLDAVRRTSITPMGEEPDHEHPELRSRLSRLARLLESNRDLIDRYQPPLIRNCAGYQLRGVMREAHMNLTRLLVGSEGTLGLFTSAVLHTSPLPEFRGVALLLFGDMVTAVDAVNLIGELQPSACDLLDRRLLGLARKSSETFSRMIPETAEAGLLVEVTGFDERQTKDRIRMVVSKLRQNQLTTVVGAEAYEADDVDFLWTLPRRVVPLLTRLQGAVRPLPFVEDIAVPPEAMKEFLHRAQRVLQKYEVTASLYAHAASGQLHLRPFLAAPREQDGERIEALARELYQIVFHLRGSISGEHGDGLARTSFLRSQYGPLYRVFQQIKDIFDPHNLMNPGKIVCDDPHLVRKNFRTLPEDSSEPVVLQLQWSPAEANEETARCNGCGICRTQDEDLRMCPFFRIEPQEDTSPRSKVNLLRSYLDGSLAPDSLRSEELKRLSNSCFNCKQCQLECPSEVDIPRMLLEARASYVSANGLSRADWILSRAQSFGAIGCAFPALSNWVVASSASRWVVEKLLGISRQRRLPTFARRPFLRAYQRRNPPRPTVGQKNIVVYFVDHFANYHDTKLAEAFVAVMRHNGFEVYVPLEQQSSGMAMISAGDLDGARDLVEDNLRVLGEFAREGIPIVCTEPAAALCLKHEYPNLSRHPDLRAVSEGAVEAGAFLYDLYHRGKLKTDFQPLEVAVGYHTPCHLKALRADRPFRELLALIPGIDVHNIEAGCSGMAGAFGLTRANFETSLRIGDPLIRRMRDPVLQLGTTECSSCRMQMEQSAPIATMHPLKLMALAYGLMPELRDQFRPSRNPLLIS